MDYPSIKQALFAYSKLGAQAEFDYPEFTKAMNGIMRLKTPQGVAGQFFQLCGLLELDLKGAEWPELRDEAKRLEALLV